MQPDAIPASMVERAARAGDDHNVDVVEHATGIPTWHCDCGATGEVASMSDRWSRAKAHIMAAVLAAALEGCEVREETAAYVREPHPSRREKAGDMMPHHPSIAPHTRHVWHGWDPMIREVITMPWRPNPVEQRDRFGPAETVERTET